MAHNPDHGPLLDFAIVQNHMSFIGGDVRLMDSVLKYSYCYFNDCLINVEAQNLLSTHNHDMHIDLINQVVTWKGKTSEKVSWFNGMLCQR